MGRKGDDLPEAGVDLIIRACTTITDLWADGTGCGLIEVAGSWFRLLAEITSERFLYSLGDLLVTLPCGQLTPG